jgi:hypothetical protein
MFLSAPDHIAAKLTLTRTSGFLLSTSRTSVCNNSVCRSVPTASCKLPLPTCLLLVRLRDTHGCSWPAAPAAVWAGAVLSQSCRQPQLSAAVASRHCRSEQCCSRAGASVGLSDSACTCCRMRRTSCRHCLHAAAASCRAAACCCTPVLASPPAASASSSISSSSASAAARLSRTEGLSLTRLLQLPAVLPLLLGPPPPAEPGLMMLLLSVLDEASLAAGS